ncbi:glycosyltransferase [Tumebacillus algifaecis]|uniref:Glycosyltransferase n=1 Tax=Tumebacillus algifaecis TaxID=1214604 RepID=A0A223CWN8_9BACL|nr:glycosyltransferase [Tumebacillus algifaecis]ASS73730.1 glycosyltransferase [Tumebacillus algifaecis]
MTCTRVLIVSPVRQTPEILQEHLRSLERLDSTGLELEYLFWDDNSVEESSVLLCNFSQRYPDRTCLICALRPSQQSTAHSWSDQNVWHVAQMKDIALQKAVEGRYDAVFLIDSDLVLHPNTLQQLLSTEKEIVANLFWTRWQDDGPALPQVWLSDSYTLYEQNVGEQLSEQERTQRINRFLQQLRKPGLYQVGGLGACTLIRRSALLAGVKFEKIGNLSLWGEDRHFCVRAAALGIPLFVDTHYPAYHIYRPSDLAGGQAFNRGEGEQAGITISLCMIVKNEEETLSRCLACVQDLVDEIIVVDTGSTDNTRGDAELYDARWYEYEWQDDFASARNFAFSKATKEYILWLDADDVIEEPDRMRFRELKKNLTSEVHYVSMPYQLAFDGAGRPTFSVRRNRLVRRDRNFRWIGVVHEYLEVGGVGQSSDVAVKHRKARSSSDRNLNIYRRLEQQGVEMTARELYYFGNELRDHGHHAEAIEKYQAFLATGNGWIEDNISACLSSADCYSALGDREKQLRMLLRSLEYDMPRAECCCRLGSYYLSEQQYEKAIFWYKSATQVSSPTEQVGFVDLSCWTWLPHLQLCVCYDRLGQLEIAHFHNEQAYLYNNSHPSILQNRKYLQARLEERKTGSEV